MVILLFGISNVGKSVTGELLAEKMGYRFVDLDIEIIKRFSTTIEEFINKYPFIDKRSQVKGRLLKELINENMKRTVIAVSPIYYAKNFNKLIEQEGVMAIELQDTKEHIFERLIFTDDNDEILKDDGYKEKYKNHYLREIQQDITYTKHHTFKKIKHKYFMNNRSVEEVVDDLINLIDCNN